MYLWSFCELTDKCNQLEEGEGGLCDTFNNSHRSYHENGRGVHFFIINNYRVVRASARGEVFYIIMKGFPCLRRPSARAFHSRSRRDWHQSVAKGSVYLH